MRKWSASRPVKCLAHVDSTKVKSLTNTWFRLGLFTWICLPSLRGGAGDEEREPPLKANVVSNTPHGLHCWSEPSDYSNASWCKPDASWCKLMQADASCKICKICKHLFDQNMSCESYVKRCQTPAGPWPRRTDMKLLSGPRIAERHTKIY